MAMTAPPNVSRQVPVINRSMTTDNYGRPMMVDPAQRPPDYIAPMGFGERMTGILGGIGRNINNYLDDDEKRARLVLALNSMRLEPDAGLASAMSDQMKDARAMNIIRSQSNQTSAALRAAASAETNQQRQNQLTQLADYIESNPLNTDAPKLAVQYLADPMYGLPEGFRTKHMSAMAAGLTAGTPEYNRFMGREGTYGGAFAYSQDRFGAIGNIRKEFQGIKEVKDFQAQVSAIGRVMSSAQDPSAAGDLALIFNYMKLLDPGSTVREGEFATAEQAAGVPTRILNLYNRILEGTRLSPKQRADFTGRSYTIYEGALQSYEENYEKPYLGFIAGVIDPEDEATKYLPEVRFRGEIYTPEQVLQFADQPPAGFPAEMWKELDETQKQTVTSMTDLERAEYMLRNTVR